MPQPVTLKKLKLNGFMKNYKTLYWPKAMSPMHRWQIIKIQASYLRILGNTSRALVGLASVHHFVLKLSLVLIPGNFPSFPMSSAVY